MRNLYKLVRSHRVASILAILALLATFSLVRGQTNISGSGGAASLSGSTGNAISNNVWVNSGEAIIANLSGQQPGTFNTELVVRFQAANSGSVSYLDSGVVAVTGCGTSGVGGIMGQCGNFPYVAFSTSGWVQQADFSVPSGGLSTGQAIVQLFLGCANQALTSTGSTTATIVNACTKVTILQQSNLNGQGHVDWPPVLPLWTSGPGYPITCSNPNTSCPTGTLPTPAAGASATYTPSTLVRHQVQSVFFQLVTSATVANRYVQLYQQCGSAVTWQTQANNAQTASQTINYSFLPGVAPIQGNTSLSLGQLLPISALGIIFSADSCVLNITATNLQATDQIQGINIRELIWEENN